MVILDLEWNRGYDKKPLDEILQIGAVRVDRPGGPIRDTFCAFIRPVVHKRFDIGAKYLPELQRSRDSDTTFPQAMERFRRWCGEETEFASWGPGDLDSLEQNCQYWDVPPLKAGRVRNIQTAFAYMLGAEGTQIALWRAAEYCGVPDTFTFHNALNDAVYTAAVAEWVTEEALDYTPLPRRGAKLTDLPFPHQPKRRIGPSPDRAGLLDSPEARRPACPLCGRRLWVQRWWPSAEGRYYTTFRCPEHGRFLRRLTLSQREDGQWQGILAVPELTREQRMAYQKSLDGQPYFCKGKKKGKKKRRRYGPKGTADRLAQTGGTT